MLKSFKRLQKRDWSVVAGAALLVPTLVSAILTILLTAVMVIAKG